MDNRRRMLMAAAAKIEPLVVYKPGDTITTVNAYGASWSISWYKYTFGSSYLELQQKYNQSTDGVAIVGPLDFTKYNKLTIDFIGKSFSNSATEQTTIGYMKGSSYASSNFVDNQAVTFASLNGVTKHIEFDISGQSGSKWIYFKYIMKGSTNYTRITNITLE